MVAIADVAAVDVFTDAKSRFPEANNRRLLLKSQAKAPCGGALPMGVSAPVDRLTEFMNVGLPVPMKRLPEPSNAGAIGGPDCGSLIVGPSVIAAVEVLMLPRYLVPITPPISVKIP